MGGCCCERVELRKDSLVTIQVVIIMVIIPIPLNLIAVFFPLVFLCGKLTGASCLLRMFLLFLCRTECLFTSATIAPAISMILKFTPRFQSLCSTYLVSTEQNKRRTFHDAIILHPPRLHRSSLARPHFTSYTPTKLIKLGNLSPTGFPRLGPPRPRRPGRGVLATPLK